MRSRDSTTKKPKVSDSPKLRLPKHPHDRILTGDETLQLLKKHWVLRWVSACQKCYGRGCERCNHIGIVGTIMDERSSKHYFGNPPMEQRFTGARCNFYCSNGRMYITTMSGGGEAELILYPTQLFELMKYVVNAVADGVQAREPRLEFGVEARFTGPPALYLAALSKKRMTRTQRPTPKQAKAIKLLKDAGLTDEAGLLQSALEHEIFHGDAEESEKCRKAVGKIEPGTIFKRVGKNVVFTE